jgi:MFS family permease
VPYAAVGSILVIRRPRNVIGWVLLGMGWTFAVSFLPIDATAHELQARTASPLQMAIAWLTDWTVALTFALFALLAFSFPTGRLAQGGWRRFALIVLVLIWGSVIVSAFWPVLTVVPNDGVDTVEIPNPVGFLPRRILGVDLASQSMGIAVLPLVLVASIAAIVGRYAGARDLERLQLRWLVAAFGAIAVAIPVGLAIVAVFDAGGEVAWVPASVAFMLPPIAIGIAVTRYRLYEIDRLVSRGLSWALLSGLLVAVYAGAVILLQTLLGDLIQGQTVAVVGSTLLAAALFQPLRRRVQTVVDHRFNRARYDAERTATAFAERLRDEVDLASLNNDFAGVVDTALHPSAIGLWIRQSRPTTP